MRGAFGILLGSLALALPGPGRAAPALDEASARAFVKGLYAHYSAPHAAHWQPLSDAQASRLFDASLAKLIKASAEAAGDEVGVLDGDPLRACQDPAGLKAEVTKVSVAGGKAEAAAIVRFPAAPHDAPRTIRYELVAVDGRWRIHDLHNPDYPSLRALLQQSAATKP